MTSPSLDSEFKKYWSRLTPVQKESLLNVVKNFVGLNEKADDVNLEQYNREIDDAMKRMDEGKFITQEEVEKEAEQW